MAKHLLIVRINDKDTLIDGASGDIVDVVDYPANWDGHSPIWERSGKVHLFVPVTETFLETEITSIRRGAFKVVGWNHDPDKDKDVPVTEMIAKYRHYVNISTLGIPQGKMKDLQNPDVYYQPLLEGKEEISKTVISEKIVEDDDVDLLTSIRNN